MLTRLKKKKGTTIVEILVASLILSIGLLGFTANQMKTIFDVNNSSKLTVISTLSSDFGDFYIHKVKNSVREDSSDIKDYFEDSAFWNSTNTVTNSNCTSMSDLDDENYCTEEEMADYKVSQFTSLVKETIPDARFLFEQCDTASERMCLMVAWTNGSTDQAQCKINTTSCYYIEI